jgi:phosphotransferase system enzyme I (PtsI)
MGLNEFSMPSASILEIKNVIRSVTRDQAREITREALTLETGLEVDDFLKKKLREILPDIYSVPGV